MLSVWSGLRRKIIELYLISTRRLVFSLGRVVTAARENLFEALAKGRTENEIYYRVNGMKNSWKKYSNAICYEQSAPVRYDWEYTK